MTAAGTPRPVLDLLGRAFMDKNRAQRQARELRVELDAALEQVAELLERAA
jgi:hypothetical protein